MIQHAIHHGVIFLVAEQGFVADNYMDAELNCGKLMNSKIEARYLIQSSQMHNRNTVVYILGLPRGFSDSCRAKSSGPASWQGHQRMKQAADSQRTMSAADSEQRKASTGPCLQTCTLGFTKATTTLWPHCA